MTRPRVNAALWDGHHQSWCPNPRGGSGNNGNPSGWFTDGELVLDVDDPFLGEHHRYLLTVRGGKADCVPTDRDPDLSLDVSDLGSIYLGGTVPSTLIRAGHIRAHRSDAATRADILFRAERHPHCLHWF